MFFIRPADETEAPSKSPRPTHLTTVTKFQVVRVGAGTNEKKFFGKLDNMMKKKLRDEK